MDVTKLDRKGSSFLMKLSKKIIKEHFALSLNSDKNMNYLWYMYYKGSKQNQFRPFIIAFELQLLMALDIISEEEKENISRMFSSEDTDNWYIALLTIDNLRNQRVKIHGDWSKEDPKTKLPIVSSEFMDAQVNYINFGSNNYTLDKI